MRNFIFTKQSIKVLDVGRTTHKETEYLVVTFKWLERSDEPKPLTVFMREPDTLKYIKESEVYHADIRLMNNQYGPEFRFGLSEIKVKK